MPNHAGRAYGILGLQLPVSAQVLLDVGSTPPTLGPDDIAQFKNQTFGQFPDGLNYYTNNGVLHPASGEPGQTFTTGTATNQYILTRLAIKTAGIHSYLNINIPQNYDLRFYSVSGDSATLIANYTAGPIPSPIIFISTLPGRAPLPNIRERSFNALSL